ncbi:MAG: aldehyde dehydrogenase family protein [Planctomycetes bacterium]|nr:aldehyde dehydrogenase family protein [Planctomycetota bacterium]
MPAGHDQPETPGPDARVVAGLQRAAADWRARPHADLAGLAAATAAALVDVAPELVAASARAKWGRVDDVVLAEEWASGPLPPARLLRLLHGLHTGLASGRLPTPRAVAAPLLTPAPGERAFAALPARTGGTFDRVLFAGYRAEVHAMERGAGAPPRRGDVAVVLGAGNVVATPLCDVLHQVLLEGRAAWLKPSPLHAPLRPVLARALAPLLAAGLVAIGDGDGARGAAMARHAGVGAVHLTGALATWRALRADPALAGKHLTAEVGCCSPVIVVPGPWRARELAHVAAQLAAFVASNGGATCLAPRLLLTCADWPQRDELLRLLRLALSAHAARVPFHPGAAEAYAAAAGEAAAGPRGRALQPCLRAGLDAGRDAALFGREHFAPVLLEAPLAGADAATFCDRAAAVVRDRVYGALTAMVFAPPAVLARERAVVARTIAALPHGAVVVNGWAGLAYGLGTSPWGVPPDAHVDHGRGFTRGTLALAAPRRVVVEAPFRPRPLPPWLPAHRRGGETLAALTRLYGSPGAGALAAVAWHALHQP